MARAAEGSMRDALSAFDQVLAFAGATVTAEDVSTVLGLVGRDLLLDILTAVADEDAPAAFELAGRAIEAGYDLRLLCRELSRLVRDLMLVSVDPEALDGEAPAERARAARRASPRRSRARTCCARSTCSRARKATSAARAADATTSRWRCCAGCTCGSSRRSPI